MPGHRPAFRGGFSVSRAVKLHESQGGNRLNEQDSPQLAVVASLRPRKLGPSAGGRDPVVEAKRGIGVEAASYFTRFRAWTQCHVRVVRLVANESGRDRVRRNATARDKTLTYVVYTLPTQQLSGARA